MTDRVQELMLCLKPTGKYHINGRRTVFAGPLAREIQTPYDLNGYTIVIEGELYTILGLELHMHSPPWREGAPAGYLVEKYDS